jgi:tripartite-type tricarboxylate transporter receptor subunit TctC
MTHDNPPHSLTRRQAVLGLAAAVLGAHADLFAQAPASVVKFILPVSAGSGVDGIARAAGHQLGIALGTSVVIENQPGAGGVVGTQALVRAAPDGQVLGMVSNNHVIYPSVLKSVPFDPINDITPISVLGATPMVLVVNPALPVNNLKEFVALLKANPGKYNFASSGNGTILHLAAELFKDVTGTFSTHIPYRGFGPMVSDIVAGQVHWGVGALPAVKGQVEAGRLRALCIASPERSAAAPNIPTAVEQGFPNYLVDGWFAVVGPKGMAPDLVKRVHTATLKAFATQEVKDAMAKQGNTIHPSTPEAALAHFKTEMARYAALVKKANVVAQ